jgi:hypothetical protein
MQIEMTIRCHLMPVRIFITKSKDNKCDDDMDPKKVSCTLLVEM